MHACVAQVVMATTSCSRRLSLDDDNNLERIHVCAEMGCTHARTLHAHNCNTYQKAVVSRLLAKTKATDRPINNFFFLSASMAVAVVVVVSAAANYNYE